MSNQIRIQNRNGALQWVERGCTVITVDPKTKKSSKSWSYAQKDEGGIKSLWAEEQDAMIGILTGESNLAVLDLDKKNGGLISFDKLLIICPEIANTYVEQTRSGGRHIYFKRNGLHVKNGVDILKSKGLSGVDLRGEGGLVVAAPSIDENGEYKALNDNPILPLPKVLEDMLRSAGKVLDAEAFEQDERDPEYKNVEAMPIQARFYREEHNPPCVKDALYELRQGTLGNEGGFALLCYLLGLNLDKDAIMSVFSSRPKFRKDYTEYQVNAAMQKSYKCLRCATMQADGLCHSAEGCHADKSPAWNYRYNFYVKNWPYVSAKDDVGIAEMLADIYRDDIRYVREPGLWHVWDGEFWPEDTDQARLCQMITDMAAILLDRVLFLSSFTKGLEGDAKKAHKKMIGNQYGQHRYMRSKIGLKNVIDVASKVVNQIAIDNVEAMNIGKALFPLLNGIYYPDTDELVPHGERTKALYRTYLFPVALNRQAKCPTYDKFMVEITCKDKELAKDHDKWVGYCLSGFTHEQEIRIYKGAGANGKSVLAEIMRAVAGEGAATASSTAFTLARGGNNGRFSFGRLRGVRALICSEVAEGQIWNTEKLKAFTGGEKINAEEKFCPEFEYTPEAKVTFLMNHIPSAKKDRALERRLWVIPFNYNVELDQLDKTLKDRLLTELEGILNRYIAGYRLWRQEGFTKKSKAVIEATNDYWAEADYIAAFLSDKCDIGKDEKGVRYWAFPDKLYEAFQEWQVSHEAERLSQITFARKLNSLGFKVETRISPDKKNEQGVPLTYKVRLGLRLKPIEEKVQTMAEMKQLIESEKVEL